jgi:hypothetical protein
MARSKLTVRLVAAALSILGSAAQLGLVGTALALSVAAAHAAAPASRLVRYAELDLDHPALSAYHASGKGAAGVPRGVPRGAPLAARPGRD